ncbi:hypothetical protein SDC9_145890 [bioreactor metagenome]|uniref:Uncharacterized protein n=1 Tax=bioreactor metagenome TaxID=1076179 RepID=A0A645EDN6_9ZZZZ
MEAGYPGFVFLLGKHSLTDQFFGINFTRILMPGNDIVEFRLGKAGFITFVVAIFPVR